MEEAQVIKEQIELDKSLLSYSRKSKKKDVLSSAGSMAFEQQPIDMQSINSGASQSKEEILKRKIEALQRKRQNPLKLDLDKIITSNTIHKNEDEKRSGRQLRQDSIPSSSRLQGTIKSSTSPANATQQLAATHDQNNTLFKHLAGS